MKNIAVLMLLLAAGLLCPAIYCSQPGARAQGDPVVCLQTTKGPIFIRVYVKYVPNTAGNFLDLVSRGFYNGLSFHRVENWVIQGGDPNGNGSGVFVDPQTGQPRYIRLETSRFLSHSAPGVVAMAHSQNPNSNSCQFYIIKKPSSALDGFYSIFGGVVQGMNVVYAISPGDRIVSAQIVSSPGDNNAPPPPSAPAADQASPQQGDSGF